MHLIERYCLQSGSKIRKPHIIQKFYPLPFDKYITFHPTSKQAKTYDRWNEVLEILKKPLSKAGIQILQIGAANEPAYKYCHNISGLTSIGNVAYLLQNSLLHLSVDTFSAHIAGALNKKIVSLYSSNHLEVVRPFRDWMDEDNFVGFYPNDELKPSFSLNENPKRINKIKPSEVAKAVCRLLNIDSQFPYEEIYCGENLQYLAEIIPNQPTANSREALFLRMDLNFDEDFMMKQCQLAPCIIFTNKKINLDILKPLKNNIPQLVYMIEGKENNDPKYIKELLNLGLNVGIIATVSEEDLRGIKLEYLDILPVHKKINYDIQDKLKEHEGSEFFYMSRKTTINKGQFFPCISAMKKGLNLQNIEYPILPIINDDNKFWEEVEYFTIYKKVD